MTSGHEVRFNDGREWSLDQKGGKTISNSPKKYPTLRRYVRNFYTVKIYNLHLGMTSVKNSLKNMNKYC